MKFLILTTAVIADFIILAGSLPLIRKIMVHSPLFNDSAPQWTLQRYWHAGVFAAVTYFLLALTSDFYRRNKNVKCAKVPAVNFAIFSFLFFLGLLACWRYGVIMDGMAFMSKRALLFAMVISYFATTLIHYLIAFYFNKEKS